MNKKEKLLFMFSNGEVWNDISPIGNAASIGDAEANSLGVWGSTTVTSTIESSDKIDGDYSIKVVAIDGVNDRIEWLTLPVIAGKEYIISIWVKMGAQATRQRIILGGFDNAVNPTMDSTEWKEYKQKVIATATGNATIRIYPAYGSTGNSPGDYLYFDKVSIKESLK